MTAHCSSWHGPTRKHRHPSSESLSEDASDGQQAACRVHRLCARPGLLQQCVTATCCSQQYVLCCSNLPAMQAVGGSAW